MEQDQSQGRDGAQEARETLLNSAARFREEVYRHYRRYGRCFEWRETRDPYAILVSELMLQQTQTERVRERYREFMSCFPEFRSLAAAPLHKVLACWQGLGYNRRARYLKQIAEIVLARHHGELPADPAELLELPGIGSATAGSLAAFAYDLPVVFIETNIRRAALHWFFSDREHVRDRELLPCLEAALDRDHPREWYYALMDYGAALGRSSRDNANRRSRHYTRQPRFEGSRRQRRGQILRALSGEKAISLEQLYSELPEPRQLTDDALEALEREGFVVREGADDLLRLSS